MARSKGMETRAGLVVMAGLVVLAGGLFLVSGGMELFRAKTLYTVYFPDSGGLAKGDAVFLAGRKVGSVHAVDTVEVEEDGAMRPYVAITIEVRTRAKIQTDSTFTVAKTVTGIVTMSIAYGRSGETADANTRLHGSRLATFEEAIDEGSKLLASAQKVMVHVDETVLEVRKVVKSVDMDRLQGKANRILDTLDRSATEVEEMIKEARDPVRQTLANAQDGTGHLKDLAAEVKTDWKEMNPKVQRTLDNTESATGTVKNIVEENRAPIKALLQSLGDNVERLGPTLAQIEILAKEAKEVVIELRPKLRTSLDHASQALQNFKAATEDLKTAPWKLVNKPSDAEARDVDLFSAARHYVDSIGRIRQLIDDLDTLRRLGALTDADKKGTVGRVLLHLQESLSNYEEREKKFFKLLVPRQAK